MRNIMKLHENSTSCLTSSVMYALKVTTNKHTLSGYKEALILHVLLTYHTSVQTVYYMVQGRIQEF